MHAFIDRKALAGAAARAASMANARTTNPNLGHVHIEAGTDHVTMTATDLAQSIRLRIPARVEAGGICTVDAARLSSVVSAMADGSVSLKLGRKGLSVACGRARFALPATDGADYPPLPGGPGDACVIVDVDGEALRTVIEDTIAAISTDESRFDLSGALLELESEDGTAYHEGGAVEVLRLVATDGSRLSMSECSASVPVGLGDFDDSGAMAEHMGRTGAMVGRAGLQQLARSLAPGSWRLTIAEKALRAQNAAGDVVIVMRMVQGQFPPYRQVLPSEDQRKARVKVAKAELAAAIKRAGIMAQDRNHTAILDMAADSEAVHVTAQHADTGDASDVVPCSTEGQGIRLGLSLRLLSDAVGRVQGEHVILDTMGALDPVIVRDQARQSASWVVMPMRID